MVLWLKNDKIWKSEFTDFLTPVIKDVFKTCLKTSLPVITYCNFKWYKNFHWICLFCNFVSSILKLQNRHCNTKLKVTEMVSLACVWSKAKFFWVSIFFYIHFFCLLSIIGHFPTRNESNQQLSILSSGSGKKVNVEENKQILTHTNLALVQIA